ncbi:MAG TPA: hypothetical protein VG838_11555 [Opitutaceae bacterium]|nr:hypothetical protein [Opitutaceae bacterium]
MKTRILLNTAAFALGSLLAGCGILPAPPAPPAPPGLPAPPAPPAP